MSENVEAVPPGAVVVGVDGTDKDLRAVHWAADEAERRQAGLHLVYAVAWIGYTQVYGVVAAADVDRIHHAAERIVHDAVERARESHPGLAVTSAVVMEDAATALVNASRHAGVVVLGARGLGRIAGRLLGSVSQKVTAHAHGPVMVVRDTEPTPGAPVVVGVDPADQAPEVVQFAFEEAVRRGVGVRIVHADARERPREELQDVHIEQLQQNAALEATQAVETLAAEWSARYPDVPVQVHEVRRHPVEALVEEAANASILVVGSRARHGLAELRLGSVARGVLYEAPVVAVVRVEAAQPERA
jgi:nucleotide-binding universal stress UspA family protein